jgi:hypothetical protein
MFAGAAQRLRAGRSIARSGDLVVVKRGAPPLCRHSERSEAIQFILASTRSIASSPSASRTDGVLAEGDLDVALTLAENVTGA